MTGEPALWAKLSWPQIEEKRNAGTNIVLFVTASTEQHGRHLPLDVDLVNAWEIALRVSANTGALLLPALPFGDSYCHVGFPGLLSLSPATFVQVCTEIGEWVYRSGFKKLLFLNGHGPNLASLQAVAYNLQASHPDYQIGFVSWWEATPRLRELTYTEGKTNIGHAGNAETSLYLAIDPARVDMSKAVDERVEGEPPGMLKVFYYPFAQRSLSGCTGNALIATGERGANLLERAVEEITALVKRGMVEEPPVPVGKGPQP